jgi:putative ABC transport system substrate-binding protein
MKRRDFIMLLGGAAAAWPLTARAQQPAVPVVGYLSSGSSASDANKIGAAAFREALRHAGFVDGRNVMIEYGWADGHYDRLPRLAGDLVRRRVDAIVTAGAAPNVLAAKMATTSIPILFAIGGDPVRLGLVANLRRPGGNLTGTTNLNTEILPKRLELLHELVPAADTIALLVNPTNVAAEGQMKDVQAAASVLGRQISIFRAGVESDLNSVFTTMTQTRVRGLVIAGDGLFVSHSEQLAALALRHGIPAIFQFPQFTAAGGLMSYGASYVEQFRVVAGYTARVLRGESPAEMPVEQVARIELIINLRTAKVLDLVMPTALLVRADEIIE